MMNSKKVNERVENISNKELLQDYIVDYKRITGWAVSMMIEDFSKASGRIPYTFEELQEESVVGFMKAVNAYDPNRGSFLTLAYKCMRNQVLGYIYSIQKERYNKVIEYYSTMGEWERTLTREVKESELNILYRDMLESQYEIEENDERFVHNDEISILDNSIMDGLVDYLKEVLSGTALFVFENYIYPSVNSRVKTQKEIASLLGITQPAVSKSISKIREFTTTYLKSIGLGECE